MFEVITHSFEGEVLDDIVLDSLETAQAYAESLCIEGMFTITVLDSDGSIIAVY